MHHLYPLSKGDQLCPLGFHPQVRWPTRCKRCFRDYKEHGGRRGIDDVAISSPNLSDNSNARPSGRSWTSTQNLTTDGNGNSSNDIVVHYNIELKKRPQSWTSTPDLDEVEAAKLAKATKPAATHPNNVDISVSVQIPPRRHTTALLDSNELENSVTLSRPSSTLKTKSPSPSREIPEEFIILKSDSLAERVRKMNLLKKHRSQNSRESSRERSIPRKTDEDEKPPQAPERVRSSTDFSSDSDDRKKSLPPKKSSYSSSASSSSKAIPTTTSASSASMNSSKLLSTSPSSSSYPPKPSSPTPKVTITEAPAATTTSSTISKSKSSSSVASSARRKEEEKAKQSRDVQFLVEIKNKAASKKQQHDSSSLTTETTDTTIVGTHHQELQDELKNLQHELNLMKQRAEKAEREKSDMLLRRLASIDTGPNRTAASEALKLQQKVNEMKAQLEDVRDDKRTLAIRVRELEHDLNSRPAKTVEDELRRKLQAAEQLCEELMDENDDMKKELRGMESEMDEMHDSFREDHNEEYANLRKELEVTTKNCRILSFKLKKSERKIEQIEQERQATSNAEMLNKIKKLEEEVRFSNELAKKLQVEAEELKNPGKKKAPMLGVLGKSTSADAKITRESLTRGGSQEDPQQLLRDLQDSIERESDLKEQLKFAEEEAENLRKKAMRYEDENESLMMQLKKMATRARSRKLSPTPSRLTPEPPSDRDEGISDEDDPAELRILLELNEQEAAILRLKVDDLEKENSDNKKQIRELQDKISKNSPATGKKSSFLSLGSSHQNEKKIKSLEDELEKLKKSVTEKDKSIEKLQSQAGGKGKDNGVDTKRQLDLVEQEASVLRGKLTTLERENEKLQFDNKKFQLLSMRKNSSSSNGPIANPAELVKLKESLSAVEKDRDDLTSKLKIILQEAEEKLPARTPKRITDLTPKSHLKKWVEELEDEIRDMRAMVLNSGGDKVQKLETDKSELEKQLQTVKDQMSSAEAELKKLKSSKDVSATLTAKLSELETKHKKSEDDGKKLTTKIKDLEERIKKQDNLIKQAESNKTIFESQTKRDKEKLTALEKDYDKEKKDRERWEAKVSTLDDEISVLKKSSDKIKTSLEKEIKELKSKANSKTDSASNKQMQELKKQIEELQSNLSSESNKFTELNGHYERLSEENILMKAQTATEKKSLQAEIQSAKQKIVDLEKVQSEKAEVAKKLATAQKKITDLECKNLQSGALEYEKTRLKNSLEEKEQEYNRLRRENEMNIDLVFQLRKENDDLSGKLNDFERISRVRSSMNEHSNGLENEIKSLKMKLENAELNSKSEVASTRLRYEQQVKNLSAEINSMQRQCERFKKDRDTFKQLLESAQKKIGDLKASNTGRQSRGSMHSSDNDDDKGKIIYLEQQVGCLEDQLCEVRLEANKLKTELVSERSANEIKISEMRSKLNEFEEERVIASRTKIPGMKTRLELSWQKEREDQQRLLQETSTLARDLRQTLFEVERERDKERLETKRKLDQLKRANEEELEEGRNKIAELQCDLLELRDAHAKIRTSNEKLRRERERHEKELAKRRMEQDGGERKVGALLQTVDELVKIAPDLKIGSSHSSKPDPRARSPSPAMSGTQITSVLARLAEASEELRKFQRISEDENERTRLRRSNLRRAASQENDATGAASGSTTPRPILKVRGSGHNGSLYRKSLSLDHSIQQDQLIWRQDDGSMSSMQSIDSELAGFGRDSSLDSRLSGGSTQSDIPRGPRKKKKGLMGKLRSLTKSGRHSESEMSIQGSDSDASIASDRLRSSKKDLRGRLSGMFKRSGSTSRGGSTEQIADSQQRPVAVTVVRVDSDAPPKARMGVSSNNVAAKPITRTVSKPPTPSTPTSSRKVLK